MTSIERPCRSRCQKEISASFPKTISDFDLMNVPTHCDTGYIVECDLKYPEKLHELPSDYPMAPEHLTVSPEMLSDFCSELKEKNWIPSQKLIPNLLDKTKYVCHYRNQTRPHFDRNLSDCFVWSKTVAKAVDWLSHRTSKNGPKRIRIWLSKIAGKCNFW